MEVEELMALHTHGVKKPTKKKIRKPKQPKAKKSKKGKR